MDKSGPGPTIIRRFTQALVEAAADLGVPVPEPALDNERVALDAQDAFWEALCQRSDEPLIGLLMGQRLQVGHLDVAGLLLMSCETLGEALETYTEYHPIVSQGGEVSFHRTGNHMALSYAGRYTSCRAARAEMSLAYAVHLARWCTGGRFEAHAVEFRHAPQDTPQRYVDLLGCAVHFEAAQHQLLFDPSQLALPLIQANPGLRDQLRSMADQMLAALGDQSLSAVVAERIAARPQASKEDIAKELALSGRHLARKLADEGFSFRQLRDRELQRLAVAALARGDKIAGIAMALGFSDESAFSRSFRRWTGTSPSQHRDARSGRA